MDIVYRCPECSRQLGARLAAAGAKTICPSCKTRHTVPRADSPEAMARGNTIRSTLNQRPGELARDMDALVLRFACMHCGGEVTILRDKAGKSSLCPKCGRKTDVPAPPPEPPPELAPTLVELSTPTESADAPARLAAIAQVLWQAQELARRTEVRRRGAVARIIWLALEGARKAEALREAEEKARQAVLAAQKAAEEKARKQAELARQVEERARQAALDAKKAAEDAVRKADEEAVNNPPTIHPGVPLSPVPPHLVCELYDPAIQRRLLQRLRDCLARGFRDPEMLYLGGRIAASLALEQETCRFLDPLSEMLHEAGTPAPAFFPVGLLYMQVLSPGPRRDTVRRDLEVLAARSAKCASVLERVGFDPKGRLLVDSPHQKLRDLQDNIGGCGDALLRLCHSAGGDEIAFAAVAQLAHEASSHYRGDELGKTRRVLEDLLLQDGDQPDVLRNLITLTSEQNDVEANERYWRRYIKLLLWRVMRGDGASAAWEDLIRFYSKVAAITDRPFAEPLQKAMERLRQPGLLPRWLEAHAALIWLDPAARPNHSLTRFWFRVFYPEFAPYLDPDRDGAAWTAATLRRCALPIDPGPKLLGRFLEWSKVGFALRDEDGDGSPHLTVVTALIGCAGRTPYRPHVRELSKFLDPDEVEPPSFRLVFQEACSVPMKIRLDKLLKAENWHELAAMGRDAENLPPMLRLFVALALCKLDEPMRGLEEACRAVPDLTQKDVEEESTCFNLWKNVLHANLGAAFKLKAEERDRVLEEIEETIGVLPDEHHFGKLKEESLRELHDAAAQIRLNQLIEETLDRTKELVEKEQFAEAMKLVKQLPDSPEQVKELKDSVLKQIAAAEESALFHKRLKETMDSVKGLVEKGQFAEARRLIRQLPDSPAELVQLKENVLGQINDAEESSGIQEKIDKALEKTKGCIERGDFSGAKSAINALPDRPAEMKDLKKRFLDQVRSAEKDYQDATRENAAITSRLSLRGIDWNAVGRIARDNNLDMTNPLALNALLKAIEQQL